MTKEAPTDNISNRQLDLLVFRDELRSLAAASGADHRDAEITVLEERVKRHPYVRQASLVFCANKLDNTDEADWKQQVVADRRAACRKLVSKRHESLYVLGFTTHDDNHCLVGYTRHLHKADNSVHLYLMDRGVTLPKGEALGRAGAAVPVHASPALGGAGACVLMI